MNTQPESTTVFVGDLERMTTLTGYGLREALERLSSAPDACSLPPLLNEVFGLCGLGWGYTLDPHRIQLHVHDTDPATCSALVLDFALWYRLRDAGHQVVTCTIPATGGSTPTCTAQAVQAALTAALAHAVSYLSIQTARPHDPHPPASEEPPAAPSSPPRTPTPTLASGDPDAHSAPGGNGNGQHDETLAAALKVILPFGTRYHKEYKGKTLGELEQRDRHLITWLAQNCTVPTVRQAAAVIVEAR